METMYYIEKEGAFYKYQTSPQDEWGYWVIASDNTETGWKFIFKADVYTLKRAFEEYKKQLIETEGVLFKDPQNPYKIWVAKY